MSLEMIQRTTLEEMVVAWKQSKADVEQAFALLVGAEQRMKAIFKPDSFLFDMSRQQSEYRDYEHPEKVMKLLKKDVWRALIDRMELRRVMSVKKAEELDRQIESGEGLPDIEVDQILGLMDGMAQQVGAFMDEAVKETFDYLRPHRSSAEFTNGNFQQELGRRAVKPCAVERKYNGTGFHVSHYHEKNIRALDNVFHLLDGKGTVKTHRGPLMDAIEATGPDGRAETEYFKVRCYQNRNLHIEFKRADLLAKLNGIVGGHTLKTKT